MIYKEKYKSIELIKLLMRNKRNLKNKSGGRYTCEHATSLTDWSGNKLSALARQEVTVHDIVRVNISNQTFTGTRYIRITQNLGDLLVGFIEDPYWGNIYRGALCHTCAKKFDFWSETVYCGSGCYYMCESCYIKTDDSLKKDMQQYPFKNGVRIVFKRSSIMEIPDWTTHTTKIINRYMNKVNQHLFE